MPKVLRIINRFNLGGPTFNAVNLTAGLAPEYETLLVGGSHCADEDSSLFVAEQAGLRPQVLNNLQRAINPVKDMEAYREIRKIIRAFRPDIVHTHASKAGFVGRLAAIHEQVPAIYHTFHGHVFHSYFSPLKTGVFKMLERYLAKHSRRIIAISALQQHELVTEHKICPLDKTIVIPLGINLQPFLEGQEEKRKAFRTRYMLSENELAVGIIGRLAPVKNHGAFLKALSRCSIPENKAVRGFVIGDGSIRKQLLQQAGQLGLEVVAPGEVPATSRSICFTSWIREADMAHAGLDVVCLTSLNEGTPVSLIEAQAAGKPVVSTEAGGVANVVLPDKSGMIVAQGDEDAFAQALSKLLSDSNLRERMGEIGRENVTVRFGVNRLVEDIRNLYEQD